MRRSAAIFVLTAAALAACGDDSGSTTTTSIIPDPTTTVTTIESTTTTVAPSTTLPPTTTTIPAPTTTAPWVYVIDDTGVPAVLGSSGDPHGSGCVIPPGDTLPDGIWFGYAEAYVGGVISLDVGCYFSGDAATAARIEDGLPGESDLSEYVRNQNPRTYQVLLAADAEVYAIPGSGTFFPQLIPAASWPSPTGYFTCPGEHCPVWVYVNSGVVTGLVEQFFE